MRVDHLAYQRATNVAAFGFCLQLVVAMTFLVYGLAVGDSPSILASLWSFPPILIWVGLMIVFNQHKLERLESLEEDQLTSGGMAGESIFDRSGDEVRVAAGRLRLLYKWALPVASILYVASLGILAWRMFEWLAAVSRNDLITGDSFLSLADGKGWLVALCLGLAATSYIFSRYLSGMSEHKAWQNLRAGAGAMVGNALVLLAVAIGVIFRFFEVNQVLEVVAWSIPIFMCIAATEVLLNIILNIYRPRVVGEFPRPGFDSRALSLMAQPDSFVRSMNDAVNYQFGFDISSSWGYQLVLRSGGWLVVLGAVALIGLSTLVVVDGREEGLRIRHGRIIGENGTEVHGSGLFVKLPWPLETAQLYEVTTERELSLNGKEEKLPQRSLWGRDKLKLIPGDVMEPFLVGRSRLGEDQLVMSSSVDEEDGAADQSDLDLADDTALVDMHVNLAYIIRGADSDNGESGLLKYLSFGTETKRRERFTEREKALQNVALSVVTKYIVGLGLDDVLSLKRGQLSEELLGRIQKAFDRLDTGVELVGVSIPLVRPVEDLATSFEDLDIARQQSGSEIVKAEKRRVVVLTETVGDPDLVDEVLSAIDKANAAEDAYDEAVKAHGEDSPEAAEAARERESLTFAAAKLVRKGGGGAAELIAMAERDSWIKLMDQRTQASRIEGQGAAYHAAPELYRQWWIMQAYTRNFADLRKYIVGIEPDRMKVNVGLSEYASPGTIYSDTLLSEEEEE